MQIGISEDQNKKFRRTMEDKVTVINDFNNVPNQLYAGLFDGHAGKSLSDYCGANLHQMILNNFEKVDNVSDNLNQSFLSVDNEQSLSSGCTAVVSLILYDDVNKSVNKGRREGQGKRTLYTANVGDARAVLWWVYSDYVMDCELKNKQ